ncbi:MAG: DegQ family serine endoprotease [Hyphomicrobiales bacterium]|nr:DegQ family serine endoprotease [Hyphomicrobiales bacterium]MCP5373937.1 DegQ family serine endoprotease [Hyphomicrobiales bacterium]
MWRTVLDWLARGFPLLLASLVLASPAPAAQRQLPESRDQIHLSFAPLVAKAAPAVVNIYTRKVTRQRQVAPLFDDPFFRRFFGEGFGLKLDRPRPRVQNSLGSGVIVGADGLIVTNVHVIEGADEIRVVLSDRREFDAEVAVTDEKTDLALLRLEADGTDLPFLQLEDSDDLLVGDLVLAIGNPFGVGQTVTSGIVSALARTRVGISDLNFFIQTDAAINPGNSGGALITMDGKVVGINSAIFSKSGGSHGIGFAIPANMVRAVVNAYRAGNGKLVRPWLGAAGQPVTGDIAASLGLDRPVGILVNAIHPGSSAERGGLRVGDVVLAVNGRPVDDTGALKFRIAMLPVGTTAELTVWRNGKRRNLTMALAAAPEDPPRDTAEIAGHTPLTGAVVANMSPALAEEESLSKYEPGVIVMKVRRGSPANRIGVKPGDYVHAINGRQVRTVQDLREVLERGAREWRVAVRRDGKVLEVVVR